MFDFFGKNKESDTKKDEARKTMRELSAEMVSTLFHSDKKYEKLLIKTKELTVKNFEERGLVMNVDNLKAYTEGMCAIWQLWQASGQDGEKFGIVFTMLLSATLAYSKEYEKAEEVKAKAEKSI